MVTPEREPLVLTVLTSEASEARWIDLKNKERSWIAHKRKVDVSGKNIEIKIANRRLKELGMQMRSEI